MKDVLVDGKKGCIICTNSCVATQTAEVVLTAVRVEFVKSHSSQKYFVLGFFNREYCHLDRFPSDPSFTAFFPWFVPRLAVWC